MCVGNLQGDWGPFTPESQQNVILIVHVWSLPPSISFPGATRSLRRLQAQGLQASRDFWERGRRSLLPLPMALSSSGLPSSTQLDSSTTTPDGRWWLLKQHPAQCLGSSAWAPTSLFQDSSSFSLSMNFPSQGKLFLFFFNSILYIHAILNQYLPL